jgi:dTDP-glucose 4,6-dehydratase
MFGGLLEHEWRFFSGKRIFLTGGSGFIGKWLLSAICEADRRLGLGCQVVVLTRSPASFIECLPSHLRGADIQSLQGDVRTFSFPEGAFDMIFHGATDIAQHCTPLDTFSTCVGGTQRVLEFARAAGVQDFLLLSSGAVYGVHPSKPSGLHEVCGRGPDPMSIASAYGEGKRASEWLANATAHETGLRVKVGRIYAQVGPYLPLDRHFAIGNFIADALAGRTIVVRGDGTPYRSYLHVADTVIWLLAMVVRGAAGRAWNIGGSEGLSIESLARRVQNLLASPAGVEVMMPIDERRPVESYIPDTRRSFEELQLAQPLSLDDSIVRTAKWLTEHKIVSAGGMK